MADLPDQPASPPDWDRIDEDVLCPLCDYNLYGLTEPRCPECGYPFAWPEILDPMRRHHRYLFEHHPERRLWSLRKTIAGGLLPRRFWRSIHASQPSYPRQLLVYWCLLAGIHLLALAGQLSAFGVYRARETIALHRRMRPGVLAYWNSPRSAQRAKQIVSQYGSIQAYVEKRYPLRVTAGMIGDLAREAPFAWDYWGFLLLPLLWPWLVFAGLMVFRISMWRARVKSIHVVRCISYCYDWLVLVGVMLLGCAIVVLVAGGLTNDAAIGLMFNIGVGVLVPALIVSAYRLATSYRLYLRFDHPVSTCWPRRPSRL